MQTAPEGSLRMRLGRGLSRLAALGSAAAALVGCAQINDAFTPPPVNPSSPIAAYAEHVSERPFALPTFQDVPPKPANVRSPAGYKTAVMDEITLRRELLAWRAKNPPMTSDTNGWADLQRSRIPAIQKAPVATVHDAESEAFAKRLREAAVKPQ